MASLAFDYCVMPPMASKKKRLKRLTGSHFADSFVLSMGRSVIRDFDPSDGDFIGIPSDTNFKLIQRKRGVVIRGKGFRSLVKGATLDEVEDSLEILDTASGWDDFKDPGVIVQTGGGRLIFSGKGNVTAPPSYYLDRRIIDIQGEVSFPGDGMVLDGNDTSVTIYHYESLGQMKIDGGEGNDTIHLGPPVSRTSKGGIEPANIEVLRLDQGSQRWGINGELPNMSVEIYDGGIEVSEDTRLKKISVIVNDEMIRKGRDELDPFVAVKEGDTLDFNQVFTSSGQKMVFDPLTAHQSTNREWHRYLMIDGKFRNATLGAMQPSGSLKNSWLSDDSSYFDYGPQMQITIGSDNANELKALGNHAEHFDDFIFSGKELPVGVMIA